MCGLLAPPVLAQETSADIVRGDLRAERLAEAERHARDLLAATERLHGSDARETADVLDLLAEAMRKAGKTRDPQSLEICRRALEIKQRLLRPDDPSLAISLENLGALHLVNGEIEKARQYLGGALDIRTRALGPWNADVAWSLTWLSHLEEKAGNPDSAYVLVKRAVAIQDSVLREDDLQHLKSLDLLGVVQYERGDYRDAAAISERALGAHLSAQGLYTASTASALHSLGVICLEMGDYGEASHYLERARSVQRRVLPSANPQVVRTTQSLGTLRERVGDVVGALAYFREAERLARKVFGPENSEVGWYLMHMGRLESNLGRRADARRELNEARRIQEKTLDASHPELAMTLRSLAEVEGASGGVDSAVALAERALQIQEHALGPGHPDLAPTLADLALFHAMRSDTAGALDLALRSARVREDHLRLMLGGLSERQGLAYAAVGPTGLDVALSLVAASGSRLGPEAVGRVWEALVSTRTLVLDEMATRHRAAVGDSAGAHVAPAAQALAGARQRLANLLVRGPARESPERYQSLLRTARLEMERAERELGNASSTERKNPGPKSNLKDVLGAIPPGWGLVAYASYASEGGRRYVALVRKSSGEPVAVPMGDAARIDRLARKWVEIVGAYPSTSPPAAAQAEAAARQAGRALRTAIWDPVAPWLEDAAGVLVVPDGSLQNVSLGALPADDRSYLIEKNTLFHYVTSEVDIPAAKARGPQGSGLLALGGVDFGPPSTPRTTPRGSGSPVTSDPGDCSDFYGAAFTPLPQSLMEVEDVGQAWGDPGHTTILTGDRATETAFKRLAPGRQVIHLATHGFFLNPTSCLQELAGSRGIAGLDLGVRPKARPAFDQQSPLLLSGLALAAANRRSEATPHEEDGILTAEEVASLDLHGVDWAVLSACDTGVANASRGEGVLGLRRAFRTAGVATLVISLWPVQDEAARDWMRALYLHRFHEGVDTAHAARAATLDVLHGRRAQGRSTNPFYWAAFVATGDWQ